MRWREKLATSDKTVEEKTRMLMKKKEKRDYIFTMVLIFSFFGSFLVLLVLNFVGLLGNFPDNALINILLWLVFMFLVLEAIDLIRRINYWKDKRALQVIGELEEFKSIWRKL